MDFFDILYTSKSFELLEGGRLHWPFSFKLTVGIRLPQKWSGLLSAETAEMIFQLHVPRVGLREML